MSILISFIFKLQLKQIIRKGDLFFHQEHKNLISKVGTDLLVQDFALKR